MICWKKGCIAIHTLPNDFNHWVKGGELEPPSAINECNSLHSWHCGVRRALRASHRSWNLMPLYPSKDKGSVGRWNGDKSDDPYIYVGEVRNIPPFGACRTDICAWAVAKNPSLLWWGAWDNEPCVSSKKWAK